MEEKGEDAVISWEEVIEKSKPLADALSGMSDEDAEYVTRTCLGVVHRKQGMECSPCMSGGDRRGGDLYAA